MALGSGTGEAVVSLFAGVRERAAIRLLYHTIQAALPSLQGVVLLEGDPRQHPREPPARYAARFNIGDSSSYDIHQQRESFWSSQILRENRLQAHRRLRNFAYFGTCRRGVFTPFAAFRSGRFGRY